jgi:hypothetical protein
MVILDVRTRWNSTYDMLVRAEKLKEVSLLILILFVKLLNNQIKIKNYTFF